jgi:hypothetical protein
MEAATVYTAARKLMFGANERPIGTHVGSTIVAGCR